MDVIDELWQEAERSMWNAKRSVDFWDNLRRMVRCFDLLRDSTRREIVSRSRFAIPHSLLVDFQAEAQSAIKEITRVQ